MINIFKNKTILVTGAVGTIGRELARQLLEFGPTELRLLDNNESEVFFLHEEYASTENVNVYVGSIRDRDKLESVCRGVNIVFHVAAFKHVYLSEYNPFDAVMTNVIGTQNVLKAATAGGAERVLFTSSDKAVNPTNVMGSTKLLAERLVTAYNVGSGRDKTDYAFLRNAFEGRIFGDPWGEGPPDAVVHYAEQPSAPYSMIDRGKAVFTITNNLVGTANLIYAVKEYNPDCHIVKLGTMGVYGTPNIDIEEGYLEVEHKGRRHTFLYPKCPGSLYHLTKAQDGDLLYFYVRMWDLRVTDLNQGPVYGIETAESQADDRLLTIFNYDDVFGTVLNRFLVQAAAGFPLTVYGRGGQTRGYLDIRDTLACVELSIRNPADRGRYRVFNQFVETFTVNELAEKVVRAGRSLGIRVEVKNIANPRREAEEHYYNPAHTGLLSLGLEPHYLTEDAAAAMLSFVMKYKDRIRRDYILPKVAWT